jgi:hypothetical protein
MAMVTSHDEAMCGYYWLENEFSKERKFVGEFSGKIICLI